MFFKIAAKWLLIFGCFAFLFCLAFFLLLVVCFYLVPRIREHAKRKTMKKEFAGKIAEEELRLKNLPPVNTQWLLRVPDHLINRYDLEDPLSLACSFAVRRERLLVFDESGAPWVGLCTRETLQSLRDSECVQRDYWVPFRGAGEKFAGKPAEVDGIHFDVYPAWLPPREGNTPEWHRWAEIYKKFAAEYARGDCYRSTFCSVLTSDWLREVKFRREQLSELRVNLSILTQR